MFRKFYSWLLKLGGLDNESRYKEVYQNPEYKRLMRLVANKHFEENQVLREVRALIIKNLAEKEKGK